jgi:glucose/arabinose dehydrogenase
VRPRRLASPRLLGALALAVAVLAVPAAAATLPSGFAETRVATGLASPTAMAFAPDGRLFVAEQGGSLRIVKNGTLLATPFLTVPTTATGERGLLGVAFDPGFATNNFVYVYYTAATPNTHNRVSRFTASGDRAVAGSEMPILDLNPLSGATNHNGGAIHFGPDGKLYVAVGDNASGSNAQSFSNLLGKILRINADGTIPADNPFFNTATGQNRAIWALGLRNPFTFTFQPGTGRMFVNDVGQTTWEEIDDGIAGSNYGWPTTEGPTSDPRFRSPLFWYGHGSSSTTGCAITGGAFYNPSAAQFPSDYVGDYFFADYCSGWIRKLDPASGNTVAAFATGAASPVDLLTAGDGSLWYLTRGSGGSVFRVTYTASQAPTIATHPASQTVGAGSPATFTVAANGTAPLAYQWQRNGTDIAGATSASYTIASAQAGDNGARFRVRVSNSAGGVTSNEATLTVTANQPPTATITAPAAGSVYAGGDTIAYAGTGTDPEDGTLGGTRFTWRVDFHHADHTHPFVQPTSGSTSGTITIPTSGETASDVWYRIHLTVTDSAGLTSSTFRDVDPRLARVTLATSPAGLQLRLDGQPVTTPLTFTGVVGIQRSLEAPSPQVVGLNVWTFDSWSNGGAQTQTISTPAADTTYTATYRGTLPLPPIKVDFQPAGAPTVAGYLVDAGAVYGDRGNGQAYGWNASTVAATWDRNSKKSPDQRYDTLTAMQHFTNRDARWELAVPNGDYAVRVVSGDANAHNSVFKVTVEGVLTVDGDPTAANRWIEATRTVTVSDGRLTIANGAGASNNKLCFVEVTPAG